MKVAFTPLSLIMATTQGPRPANLTSEQWERQLDMETTRRIPGQTVNSTYCPNFLRFQPPHTEWSIISVKYPEWKIERMQDYSLESMSFMNTCTVEAILSQLHPFLNRVVLHHDILDLMRTKQMDSGMNRDISRTDWWYDLYNELQPMLAHFTELRKIKNKREQMQNVRDHCSIVGRIISGCSWFSYWESIQRGYVKKASYEELLDAIEDLPTPQSTTIKMFCRVRFGMRAIVVMTHKLLELLSDAAWFPQRQRTKFYRDGKEVKVKQKKYPFHPGAVWAESAIQQDAEMQQENTTFTDQRETVVDDGYITSQTQPNMQQVSMAEQQWHVKNVMNKPIPIWSDDWSTSKTEAQVLKQWYLPGDALFGPHSNQVATFTFFRGHPTIRIQVNGTKFHSGRLLAVFIPVYTGASFDEKLYPYQNYTSFPHVMLDASISNSGVINLPFVHMNTYFNSANSTRSWQQLGMLKLVVFNRLRAATSSSQNIGVTVWVSYDDCELHQPCKAHTINLPKAPKTVYAESAIEGLVKSALPTILDVAAPELQLAGNASNALSGLIGNVSGGSSNQDKPTDPLEIQRWVPNVVTGLSQGEGLDRSSRLCLHAGTYTIPDADMVSTTNDDMDLRELMKIPTQLDRVDWKSTQSNGTLLLHIPICPNLVTQYTYLNKMTPPLTQYSPTLLAYIARYFKFWRGSLRYRIQIIASQMHTGRLMISYGAGLQTEGDFAASSYLNTFIVDLQEKHEVEFTTPFLAERPWLRCDRLREKQVTEDQKTNYEEIGYLSIHVLNRLSHPEAVANQVDINVFVSAGDDIEVAFPSELNGFRGIGEPITVAKAEAAQETVNTRTDQNSVSITKGSGYVRGAGATTMSENSMNLKTLLRRYTKVYSANSINVADGPNWMRFANTPTLSGVNKCFGTNGVQCRTALTHFSELFTFWRGSIRYKLIYQLCNEQDDDLIINSEILIRIFHVPGVFQGPNFQPSAISKDKKAILATMESQGVVVGSTKQQGSIEFEIPFYTPYTQLQTITTGIPNARSATGMIIISLDTPYGKKGTYMLADLYQAAGDDFVLNYLRGAPKVQFLYGFENEREMTDIASWINSSDAPICSKDVTSLFTDEDEDEQPKRILAEAWTDHLPGVSSYNRTMESITKTTVKVDSICDTANHILQQAGKKLGVISDEEEEEKTTTVFEDVSSFCSPVITSLIEQALNFIKMLPDTLQQHFKPEMDLNTVLVEVSNLVSGFNSYLNASNFIVRVCSIVTVVSTLLKGVTVTIKNSIYHFVTNVLTLLNGTKQGNQVPVVHAETSAFDLVAPLTATLAVGVGAIGFKKIPSDKETIDMCKGISEKLKLFNFSSTACSNIKGLWNEIKELMQWCIDYIMSLLAPEFLAQLKLQQEFENIETWAQFIDSLDNIAYADRIHYDMDFKHKIFRAIDQGKAYNTLLLEGKCGRSASVVREYVRKIMEIGIKCENSKNELPFRVDPFCIFMFGATNIGKSGCITTLGFDLMDRLEYPRYNRWCAINCNDKYFAENYRQQSAVYFDDFATFTSEEQYQKFFNLKANTAFPLDMAFRKGEYFNSDFVFGTTNTPYPEPNCLTHHQAFLRRRDILIEAAWSDDEEIQEALRGHENMRSHRKLDNSHLKFRIRDSSNPRAPAGNWMNYEDLLNFIALEAYEHLYIQKHKLRTDLERAGYIVPQAEAGPRKRICQAAAETHQILSVFDPELWKEIEFDNEQNIYFCQPGPMEEEFQKLQDFFTEAGISLYETLQKVTYTVKKPPTLTTKITLGLGEFKTFLQNCYEKISLEHPWLTTIGKWTVYLAGAIATLSAIWFGTKKIIHACACAVLGHYGFRCGLCGKWPKFSNVLPQNKEFMLNEWQKLYGNLEYTDNYVTTLQEEAALLSTQQQKQITLEKPKLGTQVQAEVYSDITKGAARVKVMANNTTYSDTTKGQTPSRVMANTEHTETLINSRVFPYLYRVRTRGKVNLPAFAMNGYAIGDRWLLVNAHFFFGLEAGDFFEVFHNGAWMEVEFIKSRGVVVPKKDLMIYQMPIQFHAHKDNTRHFISEKELEKFQKGKGALCKLTAQMRCVQIDDLQISAIKELKLEMDIGNTTTGLFFQKGWKYQKCSSFGDCGSPLLAYSDKLSGKILGIHTGSSDDTSYAQLVTREMLTPLVKRVDGTPIPRAEARLGNLIPPGHLGRIGKCEKGKGFHQSAKTEIIPTAIHGIISKPTSFPSVLSSNDERLVKRVSPLTGGIEKYSHTSRPFPSEHRKIVNEMMKDDTRLLTRLRDPKPLTLSEACLGIPGLEGYERLPMSTSPGYPWILTRPKDSCGKAYLFDEEGLPLYDLKKSFEFRRAKAVMGERIESVWIDCLKDERRAWEKIQSGSTRMFTIPPVDFSLLMRMYTMDFCAAVKASRAYMDCKVGIDPQSMEWTTLYYWLAEFSPFALAGDFSRFDGSMPADIIDDVREDIDYFYETFGECSEEDKNVRKILFDELIHTVHLAKDEYYMTHIGNKSGNPITVILNSRVNLRYMALSWLGIAEALGKLEYYSMAKFKEFVRVADYGDDNIVMIKPEVIDWFNQETISQYLAEFNITYTNEEKSGVTKVKTLDECTFLKQAFANHETLQMIKVPHMKQSTILELLNWTRTAPDQDELLFDNCNDALRFAYFLGERYFNNLRDKIIAALETVNKRFLPKTYMDYHLWFLCTIGALKVGKTAEGEIIDFAHSDTTQQSRIVQALTLGPLLKLLIKPVKDDARLRCDRWAVVIPSGEGKTWLAQNYPQYFVDHDDLTLPELEKQVEGFKKLKKLACIGNALLNPQHYDTPPHDKRILLTHHPNATNRKIWRQYALTYPNFNRNNYFNRLILDHPIVTDRDQRNREIIEFAVQNVPQATTWKSCGLEALLNAYGSVKKEEEQEEDKFYDCL